MKVLINNGRRRLGIPGRPAIILKPGEFVPVNDAQLAEMHKNKTVTRWLNRGVLELREEGDVEVKTPKTVPAKRQSIPRSSRAKRRDVRETLVLPDGVTGKGVEVHHKGGGWFEVYVNGFKVTDKNIRKTEAQDIATEYE